MGAGPGDPELLTLKAWRLIQSAEVVLYDRLVSPEILSLIPESAERIHVGKQRANHTLPQDQINSRLVELARKGRKVVRLKVVIPLFLAVAARRLKPSRRPACASRWCPGLPLLPVAPPTPVFRLRTGTTPSQFGLSPAT